MRSLLNTYLVILGKSFVASEETEYILKRPTNYNILAINKQVVLLSYILSVYKFGRKLPMILIEFTAITSS